MLIFIKKINFKPGNRVRSLVPVTKFHYPEPDPVEEPVPDPIRLVPGLDPPDPNQFLIRTGYSIFLLSTNFKHKDVMPKSSEMIVTLAFIRFYASWKMFQ